MPRTKSAKRALRKSERKKLHNIFHKERIKRTIKEIKKLILEKKIEEAKKLLPKLYKFLDKAQKEKVIKKGAADRKKSKIAKLIEKEIKAEKQKG